MQYQGFCFTERCRAPYVRQTCFNGIYNSSKHTENCIKIFLCHSSKLLSFMPGELCLRQGRLHNIISQDQNRNLFIGKSAHLAKHHGWQQDEKMTH